MSSTKKYQLINDVLTHTAFGVWAIMALWFFQERLYSDSGFFLAKVVYYESFWMELNRFMRIFSQWLPLLLLKLGFELKTVILAYSFGHVFFFYTIYLIGRYKWQNHQIGWLLVLTQTVGILHGFCSPGFELYYATAFLALFAIILNTNDFSIQNLAYLFLLTITMVINYQLIIFMIGGVLLLHFSEYKFKYWKAYLLVVVTVLACFLFKKLVTTHSYEIAKMDNFMLNFRERSYDWDTYIKPLFGFYLKYYKELLLIALITIVLYLKKRNFGLAGGYVLFLIITQYIIALTYPDIQHTRYQEQCYYPLIFVTCFPLVMYLLRVAKGRWRYVFTVGVFGLILYRFVLICFAMEPFTHRVNYMHRIIEAGQYMEGHKFISYEHKWNPQFYGMSFSMGMESMLLSGLNPKRKTIHIIRDTEMAWEKNKEVLQDTSRYMFTFRSFYDRQDSIHFHKKLNPNHFNFPSGAYRYLNGQVPLLDSMEQLRASLDIKTYEEGPYERGSQANILIKMTNKGAIDLNSEQIKIAYHWWKDGKMVHWEGNRNFMEIDLLEGKEHYQYILVKMPKEPGRYELQVDPIAGADLGWMHYNRRVSIVVE